MALLIRGGTICQLCGKVIGYGEEAVLLPPLANYPGDPLDQFSDAAFHKQCLSVHPLKLELDKRLKEFEAHSFHTCSLCTKTMDEPDSTLWLGHLTGDEADPLYVYNYMRFHKSCFRSWKQAQQLIHELQRLQVQTKAEGFQLLVRLLRQAQQD